MGSISLEDILTLPVKERIQLADAIYDSVITEIGIDDLTEEEMTEIDRRLELLCLNPDDSFTCEEVKASILKDLSRKL